MMPLHHKAGNWQSAKGCSSGHIMQDFELSASDETDAIRVAAKHDVHVGEVALALLEQSEDCIKIISMDGRLEYMNCGGLETMQIPRFDEIDGRFWWSLWPEDQRDNVRSLFIRAVGGCEVEFDATCPTYLGEPRRWKVKMKPMANNLGRVAGVLCTSKDISGTAAPRQSASS